MVILDIKILSGFAMNSEALQNVSDSCFIVSAAIIDQILFPHSFEVPKITAWKTKSTTFSCTYQRWEEFTRKSKSGTLKCLVLIVLSFCQ